MYVRHSHFISFFLSRSSLAALICEPIAKQKKKFHKNTSDSTIGKNTMREKGICGRKCRFGYNYYNKFVLISQLAF
jgi:hypothetical protein